MTLIVEANPYYYDYIHRLSLYNNFTCEFIDGGGQVINCIFTGSWKRENDMLTLTYTHEQSMSLKRK
jgi:hypothetical protein